MAEKFEAWGIVEIMGHHRIAGRLSEQVIAGAALLRVDVPTKEDPEKFRTEFYGPQSIYRLSITDETVARTAAEAIGARPMYPYEVNTALQQLAAPKTTPTYDEAEYEDEQHDPREEFDDVPL